MAGFGGVAEYGITVRWNKNFLKGDPAAAGAAREFAMFGGVRFGGTMTIDSAFELGFDHIALCAGAGRPTVIPMKNGWRAACGRRPISDGAAVDRRGQRDSVANLQVRMPIVVIGGGLTAIDTATESLAYYVVQVEKFLARYEALVAELGEREVRERWTRKRRDRGEFLAHARAIRAERSAAARGTRAGLVEI
jgi:NADPH-dependent glutamate synthase beta subunit-like oxidoreductase